jgi:hypothetical protein
MGGEDYSKGDGAELKKWRNMVVIERPNGTIHYRFPMTRKVQFPFQSPLLFESNCGSWYSGRSKESRIVGELLQSGMNG